jgi:hypothetical protein
LPVDPHAFKTNLLTEVAIGTAVVSNKNKYYSVITSGDLLLIISDSNMPILI